MYRVIIHRIFSEFLAGTVSGYSGRQIKEARLQARRPSKPAPQSSRTQPRSLYSTKSVRDSPWLQPSCDSLFILLCTFTGNAFLLNVLYCHITDTHPSSRPSPSISFSRQSLLWLHCGACSLLSYSWGRTLAFHLDSPTNLPVPCTNQMVWEYLLSINMTLKHTDISCVQGRGTDLHYQILLYGWSWLPCPMDSPCLPRAFHRRSTIETT